ncbi:MAG: hypothetical protein D6706_20045 [Chloroflexi bacterium]|nr:MAG: hypothetical protein D6706_20045 [Chloroflexota bacterium]
MKRSIKELIAEANKHSFQYVGIQLAGDDIHLYASHKLDYISDVDIFDYMTKYLEDISLGKYATHAAVMASMASIAKIERATEVAMGTKSIEEVFGGYEHNEGAEPMALLVSGPNRIGVLQTNRRMVVSVLLLALWLKDSKDYSFNAYLAYAAAKAPGDDISQKIDYVHQVITGRKTFES